MAVWHYYNKNGEKITVTGKELKELALRGAITPGTMIETEDGKQAPARKVKGLTFGETPSSIEPVLPKPLPQAMSSEPKPLPSVPVSPVNVDPVPVECPSKPTPDNNICATDEQKNEQTTSLSGEWVGILVMTVAILGFIFVWIGLMSNKYVYGWDIFSPIIFVVGFAIVAFYKNGKNEKWDGYGWMVSVAIIASVSGIWRGNWVPFQYSITIALLCGAIYAVIYSICGGGQTKTAKIGWGSLSILQQCGITGGVFILASIVSVIVAVASDAELPVVISFPYTFVTIFIVAFIIIEIIGQIISVAPTPPIPTKIISSIEIIIDGTAKNVTKQELFDLVTSGKIKADTPVSVNGKLTTVEGAITGD